MAVQTISPGVLEVGASHPERRLFDALMPTVHGTSYNSYVVQGTDATALLDPVDEVKASVLFANLEEAGIKRLDYIVNLHTEQDHSGSTRMLLERFPEARLVGTAKVAGLMETHLHIAADRFQILKAGDRLELGGKTLVCHPIPFAHWPDNTMYWLEEDRILFSSDLFGAHYARPDNVFATNSTELRQAARAYFSEIMMPFSTPVARFTKQVRALNPAMIAPSHGQIWYDPDFILSRYERWTGSAKSRAVIIGYVSMHGSTHRIVEKLAVELARRGISVVCRNLVDDPADLMLESGQLIDDMVTAAAALIATPTVLGGPHPAAAYLAVLMNALKPGLRYLGVINSWGWQTKAAETINALTANLRAERLSPLLVEGLPTQEDEARIAAYAAELADKLDAMEDVLD
ncbi:MAG: FprA family A-type flavoprotein [Bacillota bacterium]|nr:FprA family A-type flavoprotein [Bacillota bacterium]